MGHKLQTRLRLYTSPTRDKYNTLIKLAQIRAKMPKKVLNHEDCRSKLCIICMEKKSCRPPSSAVRELIIIRHPSLEFDDPRLPNGICTNCRINLQRQQEALPPPFDYAKLDVGHPVKSSPHQEELCYICQHVKKDAIALNHLAPKESEERIAAKVIREQLKEGETVGENRYGTITLHTGGRPLKIAVKDPNTSQATASSSSLTNFMKEQNLSLRQIQAFEKFVRGTFGRKSVEAGAHQKIVEATHQLDEFFEAEEQEFVEKDGQNTRNITRYAYGKVQMSDAY